MDQPKIGSFLKELRKEKNLTQESLAERLYVSSRTISRWETGSNMPDIGMLVSLADFYEVSIPEIIAGERKGEKMDEETRETAIAMAEYGRNEIRAGKLKVTGYLAAAFGVCVMISALVMFPSTSSWGSFYATLGGIILLIGVYFLMRNVVTKRSWRILALAGCAALLFGAFTVSDYIAVTRFSQVPRFRYETSYSSLRPNQLLYKTLFFTVVQKNPGSGYESVEILGQDEPAVIGESPLSD